MSRQSHGAVEYAIVVPTIGRQSLATLLAALAADCGPPPRRIVVVDDRPRPRGKLPLPLTDTLRIEVLYSYGSGPAAARNRGWRAVETDWVVFLDDDVVPTPGWGIQLTTDLAGLGEEVGGSQGRITVPLPDGGRASDWERNTAKLAAARWVTADMAYRRAVLEQAGGFDERFPRAYREDTDLALRVLDAGYRLIQGDRVASHPVRESDFWASVRVQRGNADDVLMRRLHGRNWRERVAEPRGRLPRHIAITAAGVVALGLGALGHRRAAGAAAACWVALTAEFAAARLSPTARSSNEVARMAVTSVLIPPVAVAWWLAGEARWRNALPRPPALPSAVLFDRDGTLVRDVPYNGDATRVEPMPGARRALARLRALRVPVGVVTNQSGLARGLITLDQVAKVNARVDELLGPFDVWQICPHDDSAGCACRKPRPGLVLGAAAELGVSPKDCVLIGDIGSDVRAAEAAGGRGILVPTPRTRPAEIAEATQVAGDLVEAVELALAGRNGGPLRELAHPWHRPLDGGGRR